MFDFIATFCADEEGAATVEYVILAAAIYEDLTKSYNQFRTPVTPSSWNPVFMLSHLIDVRSHGQTLAAFRASLNQTH